MLPSGEEFGEFTTMSQDDTDQTCPFCRAKWGDCPHFLILAEWEQSATEAEDLRHIKVAPETEPDSNVSPRP